MNDKKDYYGFRWYAKDFVTSVTVIDMSLAARGAYITLLSYQGIREECNLPNDDKKLSRLCGCSQEEWLEIKNEVMSCFKVDGDVIYNERLVDERMKMDAKIAKNVAAGKASAEAKSSKRSTNVEQALNERSTDAQRTLNERSATSSSTGVQQSANHPLSTNHYPLTTNHEPIREEEETAIAAPATRSKNTPEAINVYREVMRMYPSKKDGNEKIESSWDLIVAEEIEDLEAWREALTEWKSKSTGKWNPFNLKAIFEHYAQLLFEKKKLKHNLSVLIFQAAELWRFINFMNNEFTFSITPKEYLDQKGKEFKSESGNMRLEECPFCQGEKCSSLKKEGGAFKCFKESCPASSGISFWSFIEQCGDDPRNYRVKENLGVKTMTYNTNLKAHAAHERAVESKLGKVSEKDFQKPYTPSIALSEECRNYLNKRLINNETIERWNVKSKDNETIIFLFNEQNKIGEYDHVFSKFKPLVAEKGAKSTRDSNTKSILFGINLADEAYNNGIKTLVICEGEPDCLVVDQACKETVATVSIPSGSSDFGWVDHCWKWLKKWEKIIVWGDNDAAGKAFLHKAAQKLDRNRCWMVESDFKDANDMLKALYKKHRESGLEQKEAFKKANDSIRFLVENAEPYRMEILIDAGTFKPRTLEKEWTEDMTLTGWSALNAKTGGWRGGDNILIYGPSFGAKSNVASIMVCEALNKNQKVMIYSGEMDPEEVIAWVDVQLAGPDYVESATDEETGETIYAVRPDIADKIHKWYSGRLFIYNTFGELGFDEFIDVATYFAKRFGGNMLLMDSYTTAISKMDPQLYAKQGDLAYRLQQWAQEYRTIAISIAHIEANSAREADIIHDFTKVKGSSDIGASMTHCIGVIRVSDEEKVRVPTDKKENFLYGVDNVMALTKNKRGGQKVRINLGFDIPSKRLYSLKDRDLYRVYNWISFEEPSKIESKPIEIVVEPNEVETKTEPISKPTPASIPTLKPMSADLPRYTEVPIGAKPGDKFYLNGEYTEIVDADTPF